ncbi:MAG: beta-lactamase family protein [Erysipelotrichaceae bacterium]|nr:beta-lactamase family protein [Erysipelotrichaceae bacterium]
MIETEKNRRSCMWDIKAATDILKKEIDDGHLPGAVLGVYSLHDSKLIALGNSCIVNQTKKMQANTVFDMASCTKVVATTTAVLQLIEKGCFCLKSTYQSLFSDFPYSDITIEQLLCHTSGLPADNKEYRKCQNAREMKDFIYHLPLNHPAGTVVEYSDFGFILLGWLVEKCSDLPLDKYCEKHIFLPLGLRRTCFVPENHNLTKDCAPTELTEDRGLIQGEVHDGKAYRLQGISGNAGLFSTGKDMIRFVRMILGDDTPQKPGKKVLGKSSLELLHKSYTEKLNINRTLGWIKNEPTAAYGDYASDDCLFHTGFSGTSIYIDFKRSCGIVLLTNRVHPNRNNDFIKDIRNRVHNVLLRSYDEGYSLESL